MFIHTEKTFTVLLPGCMNSPTHCHNSPRTLDLLDILHNTVMFHCICDIMFKTKSLSEAGMLRRAR